MSRVGKQIIQIPSGVKVEIIYGDNSKRLVSVTGPNGVLLQEIKPAIWVEIGADTIELKRENDEAESRALHGLYNRLIGNMITGVTKGFTRTLILNGVGYKVAQKGTDIVFNLGMSHPIEFKPDAGITLKILTPNDLQTLGLKDKVTAAVQVSGASKEKVGAVASRIRDLRPVEPYHMYGIRYSDEHVNRKESKSGAKKKK